MKYSVPCCICGRVEEAELEEDPGDRPMVCDRPECEAEAKSIGMMMLLRQMIEAKELPDGQMAFRLKKPEEVG